MDNDIKNKIQQGIKDYMDSAQYGVTKIPSHLHNGMDTPKITVVDLPVETPVRLGLGAIMSFDANKNVAPGNTAEETITAIISGRDLLGTLDITSENIQVQLEHYPSDTNYYSYFDAFRNPILTNTSNTTITVTVGGNTMVISNYGMTTDKYAGALIDIVDSTGALIETQTVASNTGSTITITGTWLNTTTGGSFIIFVPVFLGRTIYPWRRLYVMDGATGGVRFGPGPTGGGQNGLLNMDASGNLTWRNTAGSTSTIGGGGVIMWGLGSTVGSGATSYFSSSLVNATELYTQIPIATAGTISNLYINYGAQDASGSAVFTMRKNGSDTAVTFTVPAGNAAGIFSDTTHSFTVVDGDLIDIKIVNNATANSGNIASTSFKIS